jgi:aconitate hydratase
MIPGIELIKTYYDKLPHLMEEVRKNLGKPLTYSEKVLYAHIYGKPVSGPRKRGIDYVDFAPDRVAMQDATAQMALLQFMMAGRDASAVPASVHCDHLIMAKSGSADDLKT